MVFVFFTCFLYFNFKRVIVLKTFLNKLSGVQFDKTEIEMSCLMCPSQTFSGLGALITQ